MEVTLVKLWKVTGHIDQTEGRGGMKLIGYSRSISHAEELSAGKGVMGSAGEIEELTAIRFPAGAIHLIGERCEEAWQAWERKADALAKLSPNDRQALGL